MRIQVSVKVVSLTVVDNHGDIHNSLWLSHEDAAGELAAYLNHEPEALDITSLSDVTDAARDAGLDFDINTQTLDYDTNP